MEDINKNIQDISNPEKDSVMQNDSEPDFRISKKGILIIAVVTMYVSAIWLPFVGNDDYEEFFEMKVTLLGIVHSIFVDVHNPIRIVSVFQMFGIAAMFILPIIHLLVPKRHVIIVSIAQLYLLLLFVNTWLVDNCFVHLSNGFYFYVLATIIALVIGYKDAKEAHVFANITKHLKKSWPISYIDDIERSFHHKLASDSIGGIASFFASLFGTTAIVLVKNNTLTSNENLWNYLPFTGLLCMYIYFLHSILCLNFIAIEKFKYACFLLAMCLLGYWLGPILFVIILVNFFIKK